MRFGRAVGGIEGAGVGVTVGADGGGASVGASAKRSDVGDASGVSAGSSVGVSGGKPSEVLAGTQGLERAVTRARLQLRRLVVPDENATWAITAIPAGIRLVREHGIDEVYLLGLATDYCVLFSAADARRLGFITRVVVDGCRAIDLRPGDGDRALAELQRLGVELVRSDDVPFERAALRPNPGP